MALPSIGPWKLAVRDLGGAVFERYLAFDGTQIRWFWRMLDWVLEGGRPLELLEQRYRPWKRLGPPWLQTHGVLSGAGGTGLLTEHVQGVPLSEVLAPGRGAGPVPLEAAAWIASSVGRALAGWEEPLATEEFPDLCPASVLVGFDGAVRLTPWPDFVPFPRTTATSGPLRPLEYFTPEQIRGIGAKRGWRTYAPSMLLLQALGGRSPFQAETTLETIRHTVEGRLTHPEVLGRLPGELRGLVQAALGADASARPELEPLLKALDAVASRTWLEEHLPRRFASERSEQQFELASARGLDPEQLPADLVQAVVADGSDGAFNVLSDWLQTQGLPRGELAALQLRLEKVADADLRRAEAELLGARRTLLPALLRERLAQWRGEWKAGWLVSLELKVVPGERDLAGVLSHPTLRFLKRLRVSPDAGGSETVVRVLTSIDLRALERVELSEGMPTHGAKLRAARPKVEVVRSRDEAPLPVRPRPEASVREARVGVDEREPEAPPLWDRVRGWFTRGG